MLVLGDGRIASAANPQIQDRRLASEIVHGIVTTAVRGETLELDDDYDELEARFQEIVELAILSIPRESFKVSRQDILSAVGSCRITGRVQPISGQLEGRVSC